MLCHYPRSYNSTRLLSALHTSLSELSESTLPPCSVHGRHSACPWCYFVNGTKKWLAETGLGKQGQVPRTFVFTRSNRFHRNLILTLEIQGFYAGKITESLQVPSFQDWQRQNSVREGREGHLWARGRTELRSLQDLCNTSETG